MSKKSGADVNIVHQFDEKIDWLRKTYGPNELQWKEVAKICGCSQTLISQMRNANSNSYWRASSKVEVNLSNFYKFDPLWPEWRDQSNPLLKADLHLDRNDTLEKFKSKYELEVLQRGIRADNWFEAFKLETDFPLKRLFSFDVRASYGHKLDAAAHILVQFKMPYAELIDTPGNFALSSVLLTIEREGASKIKASTFAETEVSLEPIQDAVVVFDGDSSIPGWRIETNSKTTLKGNAFLGGERESLISWSWVPDESPIVITANVFPDSIRFIGQGSANDGSDKEATHLKRQVLENAFAIKFKQRFGSHDGSIGHARLVRAKKAPKEVSRTP